MAARKRWLSFVIILASLALAVKLFAFQGHGPNNRPSRTIVHADDGYRDMKRLGWQRVGMTAEPLDPASAVRLHVPAATRGLVVTSLAYDGPAARAGLVIGDIVTAIDRQPIDDVADADAMFRQPHPATLHIIHDGATRTISID